MTDQMSMENQTAYITSRFAELLRIPEPDFNVDWQSDETIVVWADPVAGQEGTWHFVMELGSDDDRYRFELWRDGRDTGIYVEFAFEGETL